MSIFTPPNAHTHARTFLDTLAQLATGPKIEALPLPNPLEKRARRKLITSLFLDELVKLESPLNKSYSNSCGCASLLSQKDQKITTKYCNARWCLVCNSIRTAKLINAYKQPLEEMGEKQFVTLTIKNMDSERLPEAVEVMYKSITRIRKNLKKTYEMDLTGIRKFECTYNPSTDEYHPHYHMILKGNKDFGEKIISMWLDQFPSASRAAQDVRKADEDSIMETFKYFTKLLPSKKDKGQTIRISPKALDTIFQSMKGRRVFQSFGITKTVTEEIDDVEAREFENLEHEVAEWIWSSNDWFNTDTGECLTGYQPSEKVLHLKNKFANI